MLFKHKVPWQWNEIFDCVTSIKTVSAGLSASCLATKCGMDLCFNLLYTQCDAANTLEALHEKLWRTWNYYKGEHLLGSITKRRKHRHHNWLHIPLRRAKPVTNRSLMWRIGAAFGFLIANIREFPTQFTISRCLWISSKFCCSA